MVSGGEQVRLVLFIELDCDGRPVGSIRLEDAPPANAPPVDFTGWLSLMAGISGYLRDPPVPGHHVGEEVQPTG